MKTLLLDVYKEEVKIIDIEANLDEYYRALDCTVIDIVERRIGKKWFDVMCDEEGLFREPQKISAINDMGQPMLVGNLMFFHNDGEGNLTGLEDSDIEHLKKYIQKMYTNKFSKGYPMLTQCEYR